MSSTLGTPLQDAGRQASKADESGMRGVSCCEEMTGSTSKSMAMCPMAGMCAGMMNRGMWGGWLMALPGALLIAGGLVVLLVPQVLAWLVGGTAIFMGLMFWMMAYWMHRFAAGTAPHPAEPKMEPTG
jgi:hypothetical protein